MKPKTINDLYIACKKEVAKGNGNKVIMISDDDEGNGYHYLWYLFTRMQEYEKPIKYNDKEYKIIFDYCDEDIAKKQDTIILG